MQNKEFLSVIIPVYNEISRKRNELTANLNKIGTYLNSKGVDYEVVVVDDGSSDSSASEIKKMGSSVKNLKVIERNENRGKWFTIREGFLAAKGSYRLFTDADGSTAIENLEKFWKYFEKGEHLLIGSRDLVDSKISTRQPYWKEWLGHMGSAVTRLIIGLPKIKDTQCGFKVLSEQAVLDLIPKLKVNRWGGDFELLALANKRGYKIIEVPVVWNDSGNSLVGLRGYLSTLKELLQVKWGMMIGKYKC